MDRHRFTLVVSALIVLFVGGACSGVDALRLSKEERLTGEREAKMQEPFTPVYDDVEIGPRPKPAWAEMVVQLQRENYRQVPFWRHADSVWQVGAVPDKAQVIWEEFYVWSGYLEDTGLAYIETGLINPLDGGDKYSGRYLVPEPIGRITIDDIQGPIVSFSTSTGVSGRFHLETHEWSFSSR